VSLAGDWHTAAADLPSAAGHVAGIHIAR